jgi:AraC-like DNA-binding protein
MIAGPPTDAGIMAAHPHGRVAMPAYNAAASTQHLQLAAVGTLARLSFYPPGVRQSAHSHEHAHISIIIAGSIREVSGGRDETGFQSALILRPDEFTHQVQFGPQGALMLAVDVESTVARTTASRWIHRDLSLAQRTLVSWVLAEGTACETDVDDCIQDLVAGIETESLRGSPPLWLIRARERLTNDPAGARIDALARAAGVHRAHFARAFQHWFKAPPSSFRRRAMLGRALAAVASGQCLALAAESAGFADQSHLCRTMRSLIGTTPYRLLRRV